MRSALPRVEDLERRMLLAAGAEANEQLFVYLLNRARNNPQAYAAENGIPAALLAGVASRPPLAVNSILFASADLRASEMAANNYFGHQSPVTGKWPNRVARDAGYVLPATSPKEGGGFWILDDASNSIESIAAGRATAQGTLKDLIVDEGINPPVHRIQLLSMDEFSGLGNEIGVGYALNAAATYDHYWAIHATFSNPSTRFLTGVVYADANGNNRYDLFEGLGGVTISTGALQTQTNAAGGWSIAVPDGDYLVTAGGGGFAGTARAAVQVEGESVEVDFLSGQPTAQVGFAAAQNTAPTLPAGLSRVLSPVPAGSINPPGDPVALLIDGAVTDPDPAALRGIAIVQAQTGGGGMWLYSLDGGTTWTPLAGSSAGSARLLRSQDLVRFLPAQGFTGTATLTFRAWDRTTGTAGGLVDLSGAGATGGTTAFSAGTGTGTVTVRAPGTASRNLPNDFNGDGKSDYAVFRGLDNDWLPQGLSRWYTLINRSDKGAELYDWARQWGLDGDIPVPGDYDGDGRTDYTVFRPRDFYEDPSGPTTWYVALNKGAGQGIVFAKWAYRFGLADDIPVPGDYDGDGKDDLAVFRPSDGTFHVIADILANPDPFVPSGTPIDLGLAMAGLGAGERFPVPGDYDGDGRADYAVASLVGSELTWNVRLNRAGGSRPYAVQAFGSFGDVPLAGDFDGDGASDLAFYRRRDTDLSAQGFGWVSGWHVALNRGLTISATPPVGRPSNALEAFTTRLHGYEDDVPMTGDYNGDGRSDITVYRPNDRTVPGYAGFVSAWYTLLNLGTNDNVVWDWGRGHGRPTDNPIGRNPLAGRTSVTGTLTVAGSADATSGSETIGGNAIVFEVPLALPEIETRPFRRLVRRRFR